MNTYVIMIHYTEQGARNIKQAPTRLDAAKKLFESMGANIREWLLTFGQYDALMIAEAPDDETIAKLTLTLCSLGNVGTETVRAFTEVEYRRLIEGLP